VSRSRWTPRHGTTSSMRSFRHSSFLTQRPSPATAAVRLSALARSPSAAAPIRSARREPIEQEAELHWLGLRLMGAPPEGTTRRPRVSRADRIRVDRRRIRMTPSRARSALTLIFVDHLYPSATCSLGASTLHEDSCARIRARRPGRANRMVVMPCIRSAMPFPRVSGAVIH
jgi:hypothetical protein